MFEKRDMRVSKKGEIRKSDDKEGEREKKVK